MLHLGNTAERFEATVKYRLGDGRNPLQYSR
jgi:hypothetical protein